MPYLTQLTPARAFATAALIFALVTGVGVIHGGLNPDDWIALGHVSPAWLLREGRWGVLGLNTIVLHGRLLEPLQLALAFLLFWWLTEALVRASGLEAAAKTRPDVAGWSRLSLFLVGVNAVYMCDALNFSTFILGCPLALALGVLAQQLTGTVVRGEGAMWRRGLLTLAAVQASALSIGTYQPFVVLGFVLPLAALMRVDRYDLALAVRLIVAGAVIAGLGGALYLVEWRLLAELYGVAAEGRFASPTGADLLRKALKTPAFVKAMYEGGSYGEAASSPGCFGPPPFSARRRPFWPAFCRSPPGPGIHALGLRPCASGAAPALRFSPRPSSSGSHTKRTTPRLGWSPSRLFCWPQCSCAA